MARGQNVLLAFLLSVAALTGGAESLRIARPVTCKGQDGQLHQLGESYEYGCMHCQCTKQGEMCDSPMCAAIFCENAISKGPGCCPICPEEAGTCKGQDGQLHKLGESYEYGCMHCQCTEQGEMCDSPMCAAIFCENAISKGPGCCPICPEETGTCKGQDGQLHQLGESYEYGCMHCQCTEQGEMCASPMCAAIFCENAISKGPGCCPICPEEPGTCKGQDGQLHKLGESYEYGCMHCQCTEQGEICASPRCAPITCDNFVSNGTGCCPICPEVTCKGQDGQLHTLGETYQYGCMPCECTEKGEQCYPLPCAPPPCDDYTTEGPGCCPICPYGYSGPRTPAPPAPMTCAGQDGNVHAFGEWWHYGCMPCQCTDQGEQCYPLPCQPPQCENYVTDGPGCCPTCPEVTSTEPPPTTTLGPTCLGQDGNVYNFGDTWQYGCMPCECTVHGPECHPLLCMMPFCSNSVTSGPGCCPTCPYGYDCFDPNSGEIIPAGQTVQNSLGMTCECPPGDNSPRDAMCYYFDDFTTTTPEPTTTMHETTTPPGGCYVEGNYYQPGETFSMTEPCAHYCLCQGYGQGYSCYPPPCTRPPCPNPVQNGYCCPTCPNGPVCRGLDNDEIPLGETRTYPDGSQCFCGDHSYYDYHNGLQCTPIYSSPQPPTSTPPPMP